MSLALSKQQYETGTSDAKKGKEKKLDDKVDSRSLPLQDIETDDMLAQER